MKPYFRILLLPTLTAVLAAALTACAGSPAGTQTTAPEETGLTQTQPATEAPSGEPASAAPTEAETMRPVPTDRPVEYCEYFYVEIPDGLVGKYECRYDINSVDFYYNAFSDREGDGFAFGIQIAEPAEVFRRHAHGSERQRCKYIYNGKTYYVTVSYPADGQFIPTTGPEQQEWLSLSQYTEQVLDSLTPILPGARLEAFDFSSLLRTYSGRSESGADWEIRLTDLEDNRLSGQYTCVLPDGSAAEGYFAVTAYEKDGGVNLTAEQDGEYTYYVTTLRFEDDTLRMTTPENDGRLGGGEVLLTAAG